VRLRDLRGRTLIRKGKRGKEGGGYKSFLNPRVPRSTQGDRGGRRIRVERRGGVRQTVRGRARVEVKLEAEGGTGMKRSKGSGLYKRLQGGRVKSRTDGELKERAGTSLLLTRVYGKRGGYSQAELVRPGEKGLK